jgi:hypothetical protein
VQEAKQWCKGGRAQVGGNKLQQQDAGDSGKDGESGQGRTLVARVTIRWPESASKSAGMAVAWTVGFPASLFADKAHYPKTG